MSVSRLLASDHQSNVVAQTRDIPDARRRARPERRRLSDGAPQRIVLDLHSSQRKPERRIDSADAIHAHIPAPGASAILHRADAGPPGRTAPPSGLGARGQVGRHARAGPRLRQRGAGALPARTRLDRGVSRARAARRQRPRKPAAGWRARLPRRPRAPRLWPAARSPAPRRAARRRPPPVREADDLRPPVPGRPAALAAALPRAAPPAGRAESRGAGARSEWRRSPRLGTPSTSPIQSTREPIALPAT
jgi:hypothetical protein